MPRSILPPALVLLAAALAACGGEGPAPGGRVLRVAAVQFDATPLRPERNLREVERLARQAAAGGAELVLFHEGTLVDYGEGLRELAEPVPGGPTSRALAELAEELGVWLGVGLLEREGSRVHQTHAFFGPQGFAGRARKTALFANPADPLRDEPAHLDPGDGPAALTVAGARTVVLVCSDAEAPDVVERARALGPELVLFPNNRSNLPPAADFAELARELDAPVVISNRVGASWQHACNGGSAVLDARGRVLERADRDGAEEVLLCDVPLAAGGGGASD